MAKASEAYVRAGEREVRISSPERVIYEATDRTPAVTKLMVAEYFTSVEDGLMRALRDRPTALERWTSGVRPGHEAGDRTAGPQRRRVLPEARAQGGARLPRDRRRSPSRPGRTAEEICPTEIAVPVWCAHMGTLTFHPWPVRRDDVDHPDELRIDLDPQPGTTFADAVRVAGVARELLGGPRHDRLREDLGQPRASTSTSGSSREWDFAAVRHAAIAFGRELEKRDDGVTTAWWKEERGERIFVDFNQNTRDRTIASAYSLRPIAGAPVSTPVTWDELAGLTSPADLNLFSVPSRLAVDGDPWAAIDDVHHSLQPLLDLWEEHPVELNYPPDHPKMPGEPPRVQPSKKVESHWDADGQPGRGHLTPSPSGGE